MRSWMTMSVIIIIMTIIMTVIVVMMVIKMKLMFRQPVCTRLVQEEGWASRWKELSMSRRESRSLFVMLMIFIVMMMIMMMMMTMTIYFLPRFVLTTTSGRSYLEAQLGWLTSFGTATNCLRWSSTMRTIMMMMMMLVMMMWWWWCRSPARGGRQQRWSNFH